MSETKLTAAQKRAIREARDANGRLWGVHGRVVNALRNQYLAKPDPIHEGICCLTEEGWAVEVGDEDR